MANEMTDTQSKLDERIVALDRAIAQAEYECSHLAEEPGHRFFCNQDIKCLTGLRDELAAIKAAQPAADEPVAISETHERLNFEQRYSSLDLQMAGNDYADPTVERLWEGWKARAIEGSLP